MIKKRLLVLVLGVMLLTTGYAHAENYDDDDEDDGRKAGFFFSGSFYNAFFNNRELELQSNFWVKGLTAIKLGAAYELPFGPGDAVFGLDVGYSSGSNFGGRGGVDFIPLSLFASYVFPLTDFFYAGPSVRLGGFGMTGPDGFNMIPMLGARIDAELRYMYFPVGLYVAGGVDLFLPASSLSPSLLPSIEVGLRVPRGTLRRRDSETTGTTQPAASRTQTGAAAGAGAAGAGAAGAGVAATPTVTSVMVSPANQTVAAGSTRQFNATVTGTNNPNTAVTWRVSSNAAGTGAVASGTTVSPTGLLTVSPNETASPLYVIATSVADTTRTGSQSVAVTTPAGAAAAAGTGAAGAAAATPTVTSVTVSPANQTVAAGSTRQFNATVTGTNNPSTAVTWRVSSNAAGTGAVASGTTVSPNGLLTVSPNETASTLFVFATSVADTARSGSQSVAVTPAGAAAAGTGAAGAGVAATPTVTSVTVNPANQTVTAGSTRQFNATVTGTNNPSTAVTWRVSSNAAGTGAVASGTTVSPNGLLTVSPNETARTLFVFATSVADTARSGSQSVAVTAPAGAAAAGAGAAGTGVAATTPAAGTAPGVALALGPGQVMVMDDGRQGALSTLYFEPDSAVLIDRFYSRLDEAGRFLIANPSARVLLRAYAAPFGTADGRLAVSISRGRFVRDYFIQNFNIPTSRITIEAYGAERTPVEATAGDWISFRCVEVILYRN